MGDLNSVGTYLNPLLDYLQNGFDRVNAAQGLAIALIAVILMRKWVQWPSVAFAATFVHAIVDAALPIIAGQSAVKLPPIMEPIYWQYLAALYVGYLIVIAMFFAVKRVGLGFMPAKSAPAPAEGKKK
jgi:hypothetical protein